MTASRSNFGSQLWFGILVRQCLWVIENVARNVTAGGGFGSSQRDNGLGVKDSELNFMECRVGR